MMSSPVPASIPPATSEPEAIVPDAQRSNGGNPAKTSTSEKEETANTTTSTTTHVPPNIKYAHLNERQVKGSSGQQLRFTITFGN